MSVEHNLFTANSLYRRSRPVRNVLEMYADTKAAFGSRHHGGIIVSMTLPLERRRYTVEEYFDIERNSSEKYEYHDGVVVNLNQVLAMSGGSFKHALISANVSRALGNRLGGGPCRVFSSDLRVRIARRTLYAHPDATVICGPIEADPDSTAGDTALNPRLIVEVLSPGTESYDRGEKFRLYREIASLEEYVLVSQDEPTIELFFRQPDRTWALDTASGLTSSARLRSLKIEVALSETYAGVDFAPAAN